MALARVSTPLASERVELADEPVHADAQWVSAYDIDPFDVPAGRAGRAAGDLVRRGCWPAAPTTSTPA